MYINIYIKLLEPGDKIAGNGGGAGGDIRMAAATSGDRTTGPTIAAATPGEHQWRAAVTSGGRGGGISSPMRAAASFLA